MAKQITFNHLEELDYGKKEAFNSLRTNIQFCGADIKTILFTSASPGEGKSFVTFELARSEAESGKKVLFLDADLRKSVLQSRYQVQTDSKDISGLSHYLSKQTDLKDVIYKTNITGLDVILTGRLSPGPTELLGGELFKELIDKMEDEYDMILIDTPPLATVIDAAIIAPHCDGAIIIIESNTTNYRTAEKVKKQLEMADCRILGAVLNKVMTKGTGYYNYYAE